MISERGREQRLYVQSLETFPNQLIVFVLNCATVLGGESAVYSGVQFCKSLNLLAAGTHLCGLHTLEDTFAAKQGSFFAVRAHRPRSH